MGLMTRDEMITEVRVGLGGRTATALSIDKITQWLDWTQLHVSRPEVYLHVSLYSSENLTLTTAGTYTLTGQTRAVRSAVNTSATAPYKLVAKSQEWMDDRTQTAGQPRYYHSTGAAPATLGSYESTPSTRTLQIYPTPGVTYVGDVVRVRNILEPAVFASGTQAVVGPAITKVPLKELGIAE